jgi:hypothetical protein
MQLTDIPVQAQGTVSRRVDAEEVLVHPQQGIVRVLNDVGGRLWELADGERTIADAARVIETEYVVDSLRAQEDALSFYRDLASRGLLVARTSQANRTSRNRGESHEQREPEAL